MKIGAAASTTTRHRAAILCFGGWGLQTMLHLWPRLRFIQEERQALGIETLLPDLNRLTAFAAIMPEPYVPTDGAYQPFRLVQPNTQVYPKSFYVEQVLTEEVLEPSSHLLYSEQVASLLFRQALDDDHVQDLPANFPLHEELLEPGRRVSRYRMFRMGITQAEAAGRAILRHVIDPTRLDHIETRDPLVLTTLYVVASLAEPLASALVWPLVSELVASLGSHNLVNVVGIFATGSFAEDDTRVVEEAAVHAALAELEAFSEESMQTDGHARLHDVVVAAGKRGWEHRTSKRLFNRVYLLDREKSNQALASSSMELSVLAGNAIEGFLVANGAAHIETHLGPDSQLYRMAPYSIMGAANIYVPLAQYIDAAIREERKRILREALQEPDEPVQATLQMLRATPHDAVRSLLHRRTRRMFMPEAPSSQFRQRAYRLARRLRARVQPNHAQSVEEDWLPHLRIVREYIFPRNVTDRLRATPTLWQWRRRAETSVRLAAERLPTELEANRFEEAWGLEYYVPRPATPQDAPTLLDQYHRQTWSMRYQNNKRVIPAAVTTVLRTIVEDCCRAPDGILVGRARLAGWAEQIEHVLDRLRLRSTQFADLEWREQYGTAMSRWSRESVAVAASTPHNAAILARALLAGLFFTYLAFAWLLYESGIPITWRPLLPTAVSCALVTALAARLPWAWSRWRARRIQMRRLRLAQDLLSHNANQIVHDSLFRVYARLQEDLSQLRATLEADIEELQKWSAAHAPIQIPPPNVPPIHLRIAHMNDEVWQRINELIQKERSPSGKGSREEFHEGWQRDGKLWRNWMENGERLPQRVRLALEVPFNQRDIEFVLASQILLPLAANQQDEHRRGAHNTAPPVEPGATARELDPLRETIARNLDANCWCVFATAPPNRRPAPTCTACPNARSCAFSQAGREQRSKWSLAALLREHVNNATAYLIPKNRFLPSQAGFVREIVESFGLEQLLLSNGSGNGASHIYEEKRRAFVEDIHARAKPSANYDVADRLTQQLVEVDLGVTADRKASSLPPIFEERNMPILSSYDPMAISAIRTVNGLTRNDLMLAQRCQTEFHRLHESDRVQLVLLPVNADLDSLYGTADPQLVIYERILPGELDEPLI